MSQRQANDYMTAWHVVTWSSKSLRVLQRPSIVQRSPSCSAIWIHVKLCNQMPRYWIWQMIWWDFIKCWQFGPLDTAMSLRTGHLWAATGKTFDIFDPPSCANQRPNTEPRRTKRQRHNQSIAPCHGDKNKLKSSSTEALINYIPQQKARLHSCLRRQGLQLVRVTHCRSFFIWPDLPNVCGFFKQTRGSVWAVLLLLSSFNSARPTL